jgi:drug/metabolite transporter (DMT)-like permease
LIGPSAFTFGSGSVELLARLACVGAAMSYGVSSVITRRCPPIEPLILAAMALIVGSVAILPVMIWVEGLPQIAGTVSTTAIIFLGLIPTAFALLLRVRIIRSAGSVFMSLVSYQVPIWSMIFGAWILSEDLPLRFFAALALILTGLVICQWNSLAKLLSASKP